MIYSRSCLILVWEKRVLGSTCGASRTSWSISNFLLSIGLLIYALAAAESAADDQDVQSLGSAVVFKIPAGPLIDALDIFGEQSGLQVVYGHEVADTWFSSTIQGELTPASALDSLLHASPLSWRLIARNTVLISGSASASAAREIALTADALSTSPIDKSAIAQLRDLLVSLDPRRVLPFDLSHAAFGFDKPILLTPRSISVISVETIELLGLSAVEDLVRVVPGVYTTTRFGIQGSVDLRNVPADTYVRGMKRLNLQGHTRSIFGAMDTIEVVRGPPSPLYGMGKIGGYTNVIPKTGRARNGGFFLGHNGFAQGIVGSFDRAEISFGVGGPVTYRGGAQGGYYLHALLEDSGSYTNQVSVGQKLFQIAFSLDDFVGPLRAEFGIDYQRSTTSGALLNRVTQDLVDTGIYIGGQPLVNLDLNGNGKIGYLEMHEASPVAGGLSVGNQPLIQRWNWPVDAQGNYLPLDQFPQVLGIPQSMYDYLQENPQADPTGLLRAQGVGGPLPQSGYVPAGFAMDPRTVALVDLDMRRAAAFEREVQADLGLAFFDIIFDSAENYTVKNQLFFDSMDQYKLSEQPSGGKQNVYVVENKTTFLQRIPTDPQAVTANSLASINLRNTKSTGYRHDGDQGSHRTDAMFGAGGMTPNATFVHPFENSALEDDGAPWFDSYRTDYWELGAGFLWDLDFYERTNLMLGVRADRSRAKNVLHAGIVNPNAGTSANPMVVRPLAQSARAYDSGTSWSVSLSHQLPYGLRPYVTLAESSLMLENNNNRLPNAVIEGGHIGRARFFEVGNKASWLNHRLFGSLAYYDQGRMDVSLDDSSAIQNTAVSATRTKGWELELKVVPLTNMFLSMYALHQKTRFDPNVGASILVDARTLGFVDVLDEQGNIVYPAEAFLYGGRSRLILPSSMSAYDTKQGNPEFQLGINANYQWRNGVGLVLGGNRFSSTYSGRLRTVKLPSATVIHGGLFFERGMWLLKFDVRNLTDEHYFRARTGDFLGETLVESMPGRTWQTTLRVAF